MPAAQAHAAAPQNAGKPLGNFELAPEFNTDKQPTDVVYEHHHCLYVTDFESFLNINSSVVRGIATPKGYVDLIAVEGDECVNLSYSSEQTRTLARLLLTAADDTDAALAKLAAAQEGGAV